jgi:transcriptional regulator with XRE-family HTH domain
MQTNAVLEMDRTAGPGPTRAQWRRSRHRSPRDNRPANRREHWRMTPKSDGLIRVRFAHFVDRALTSARARGMTDKDIERATGVRSSTFHRWRRGEVQTVPGLDKVRAFCEGVGADLAEAMAALGVTGERDNPAPEPVVDPDMRLILRQLADPNVPEAEKVFIRESLRMLAERAERSGRRRETS